MREPSIHITRSLFKKLWNKAGKRISDEFLDEFFTMAREYSLDHRSVILKDKKTEKTVVKRVSSSIGDANLLADIIYSTRIKLKHRGVVKIKQTDMQWAQVKELVPTVNQFCEEFHLHKRVGYISYVETGLKLMSKSKKVNYSYTASWMLTKAEWIISTYQSQMDIANDKYPQETRQVHDIYCSRVLDMTGILNNYFADPTLYVNFLNAREMADKIGVDYDTFIEAQFDALSFCNGIPKIEDLSNDKARERLTQYMSKNGYMLADAESTPDKSVWESFKH